MAMIQVGQVIQNRYQIMQSLGVGGMAQVFLAQDLRLGRNVALKVIRMDDIPPSMQSEVHRRFEREPIALAKMQHPAIVTIHDFGFYENEPFFVMDYVSGGTLESLISRHYHYRIIARILAPIADALAYAHDRSILHRDVKPSNIMLTEDGQPVLTDFGIAKAMSQSSETSLTQVGKSIGTPAYMAPEQWMGHVLPQTDGYALGIVFYQMLTGVVPYSDPITMNIALKHMNAPVPQICSEQPDLPRDVDLFLAKALAKDPNHRFANMHEFYDALMALAEGRPLSIQAPEEATIIKQPFADVGETQFGNQQQGSATYAWPVEGAAAPHSAPVSFPDETDHPPKDPIASGLAQNERTPVEKKIMPLWVWVVIGGSLISLAVIGVVILALLGVFDGRSSLPTEEAAIDQDWIQDTQDAENAAGGSAQEAATAVLEVLDTQPTLPVEVTALPTFTPAPTQAEAAAEVISDLQAGATMTWQMDGMTMVYIPSGEFEMGSEAWKDPDTYTINEGPIHIVSLDAYWIDQTEVTNAQFAQFVDATGYVTSAEKLGFSSILEADSTWREESGATWRYPMGNGELYVEGYPVVHVSWDDAMAYCEWAGKRLPTEAEWEKAARGTDGNKYPWGNGEASTSLANFNNPGGRPRAVASYAQGVSVYGVFDMAGNVWELVSDWYEREYYETSPSHNPQGPDSGTHHVARGGSYGFDHAVIRSAVRVKRGADQSFSDMGFRCVVEP